MKFNPGDKVRVRQWKAMERQYGLTSRGNIPAGESFTTAMKRFCGKVVTIASADVVGHYKIKEDNGDFWWTDDMFEGHAFEYGDLIEVSDNEENWYKRIYVGYTDGAAYPYRVVCPDMENVGRFKSGQKYSTYAFIHARPIGTHTITIDGKTVAISEESYQNLKKALLEKEDC